MADTINANITALNHDTFHGWMSPPNTRGTSQILYGCLLTISACIYTSIHLNIPDPFEKQRWQIIRRIKWAAIGVFAPEVVLYTAWTQYRQACLYINKMCEVAPDLVYLEPSWVQTIWSKVASLPKKLNLRTKEPQRSDSNESAVHDEKTAQELPLREKDVRVRINLAYGFYAIMGGIRVDTSELHHDQTSMALSPKKLMSILESPREIQDGVLKSLVVGPKTIKDRSKANNMTKILICCQVLGTALQCIARKACGLPLTLLEYHTFAHVICAIGIYGVWFQKPLDVNESLIIQLPSQLRFGLAQALFLYRPKNWYYEIPHTCGAVNTLITVSERNIKVRNPTTSYEAFLRLHATDMNDVGIKNLNACDHETWKGRKAESWFKESSWEQDVSYAKENRLIIRYNARNSKAISCSCASPLKNHLALMDFTETDRNRWEILSSESLQAQPTKSSDRFDSLYRPREPNYFALLRQWGFSDGDIDVADDHRLQSFVGFHDSIQGDSRPLMVLLVATCITALYGGVHAFAWSTQFPSTVELWGWRSSCLILMTFFPLETGMIQVGIWLDHEREKYERLQSFPALICEYLVSAAFVLLLLLLLVILVAFAVARLYLVVETFVSLRSVPMGVYSTVPWSQYLPHL